MTLTLPFPNFLDTFATNLLTADPLEENPRHRAIVDAFDEVKVLERRLLVELAIAMEDSTVAAEQLTACSTILIERLVAGQKLSALLAEACCCAADEAEYEPCRPCGLETGEACCQDSAVPAQLPLTLLDACIHVFSDLGDPHAMASADLVDALRDLPGIAGKYYRYSDLTQSRLAELLAPYGLRTRDITLPDGRRRKSYTREALLAATGVCNGC